MVHVTRIHAADIPATEEKGTILREEITKLGYDGSNIHGTISAILLTVSSVCRNDHLECS